jgi:CspA family cold shock protein
MPIGCVKFYNATKGFGFIIPDDGGNDVFVHIYELVASGIKARDGKPAIIEGERLAYELVPSTHPKAKQGDTKAANLRRVG